MFLRCTFINRKYDPSAIELLHAWDEYEIDNWPEGYADTLKKELDAIGDEVLKVVTVDIQIDYSALAKMFDTPKMQAVSMEQAE